MIQYIVLLRSLTSLYVAGALDSPKTFVVYGINVPGFLSYAFAQIHLLLSTYPLTMGSVTTAYLTGTFLWGRFGHLLSPSAVQMTFLQSTLDGIVWDPKSRTLTLLRSGSISAFSDNPEKPISSILVSDFTKMWMLGEDPLFRPVRVTLILQDPGSAKTHVFNLVVTRMDAGPGGTHYIVREGHNGLKTTAGRATAIVSNVSSSSSIDTVRKIADQMVALSSNPLVSTVLFGYRPTTFMRRDLEDTYANVKHSVTTSVARPVAAELAADIVGLSLIPLTGVKQSSENLSKAHSRALRTVSKHGRRETASELLKIYHDGDDE
jgi:hypothetical protein